MSIGIILLVAGFIWLLWETELLAVGLMGRARLNINQIVKSMVSVVIGLTMLPIVKEVTNSLIWSRVPGIRRVPQGIKNHPVYLWSPDGKDYGLWPVAQAERISRNQYGWQWSIKHQGPLLLNPPILSIVPMLILMGLMGGVANMLCGKYLEPPPDESPTYKKVVRGAT